MNFTYIIEVLEGRTWRRYGLPSEDFSKLYDMCRKLCENGTKARIVRVKH